jgi:hypothetical protein
VQSRPPPASSPLTRPDPCGPSARRLWAAIVTVAGDHVEGPHGSGVNGWTPGPLPLLGRLSPAGQGLPDMARASLSLDAQPPLSITTRCTAPVRS